LGKRNDPPTLTVVDRALPAAPPELPDAIKSFVRHLKAENYSPRTIETYEESANQFANFVAKRRLPNEPAAIRRINVEAFVSHVMKESSPATASIRFRGLQSLFKWLLLEGEITTSPVEHMRAPKLAEKPTPVLTEAQLKSLLRTVEKGKDFESLRDHALLWVFICTGARRAEIAGLRYNPRRPEENDVDLDTELLTVKGKGNRWRKLPLHPKATRALDRYIRLGRNKHHRSHVPALWLGPKGQLTGNGVYQVVERRAREAGIPAHPHMFRHAFAHTWLSAGREETDLMRITGWRSRSMLQRYAAATASERALEAYRRPGLFDNL
jgi:site-specific recombinase XerD